MQNTEADGKVEKVSSFFLFAFTREGRSIETLDHASLFTSGLQYNCECLRPSNFKAMVQLAESPAEGFDFIRADLYNVKNKIYFSELTPYPGGVSAKFEPDSFDYVFGEKWKWK